MRLLYNTLATRRTKCLCCIRALGSAYYAYYNSTYMQHLRTIHPQSIFPHTPVGTTARYADRTTCKAVVLDADNHIALVGNGKNDFFLLPGGGVNDGEEIHAAIIRECAEEIGCGIAILREVGYIDDYRPRDHRHCMTYCYVATVTGPKKEPAYSPDESQIGMYPMWVSLGDAHTILKKQEAAVLAGDVRFYNTAFDIVRDLIFLEAATAQRETPRLSA